MDPYDAAQEAAKLAGLFAKVIANPENK